MRWFLNIFENLNSSLSVVRVFLLFIIKDGAQKKKPSSGNLLQELQEIFKI